MYFWGAVGCQGWFSGSEISELRSLWVSCFLPHDLKKVASAPDITFLLRAIRRWKESGSHFCSLKIKNHLTWSEVKATQLCLTLCNPVDWVHGILQARILEWVAFPFSRGSSQPRDQIQVSHIAGRFFTSWTTGKPKNTGVGSLSLLQWIFLTQEQNWGLLPCRQIFYQLSHQGSPGVKDGLFNGKRSFISNGGWQTFCSYTP